MSDTTPPSDGAGSASQGDPESIVAPLPREPAIPPPPAQDAADQAPPQEELPTQPAEGQPQQAELPSGRAVVARYGVLRALGLFHHDLEEPLRVGTKLVVRSERGLELAEALTNVADTPGPATITREQLAEHLRIAGSEYPFYRNGRVLRLANTQDLIDDRHLAASAREEAQYCRKEIREMRLDMKVVTVEHLLGGERIIFYFCAENRVDFRELVRRLASQFRTRIEMRQVGARDEARLVGDFERCGRPCCCQSFLKDLKPVSMRMAKTQKATLDPSKISGRCGRLMCCLRYEDAGYEELRAKLPRKNSFVRTGAGVVGKVLDVQVLTQLVRLLLADGTQSVVANEEIADRNVPAPPPGTLQAPLDPHRPVAPWRAAKPKPPEDAAFPQDLAKAFEDAEPQDPVPETFEPMEADTPNETPAPVQAGQYQAAPSGGEGQGQGPPSGRRRRRRHRGRPNHGQGQGQPAQAQGGNAQPPPQTTGQSPRPPGQSPGGGGGDGGRRQRRRRRHRH